jgi:hypothetical protein
MRKVTFVSGVCEFPNYLTPSFLRYLAYDGQNERR